MVVFLFLLTVLYLSINTYTDLKEFSIYCIVNYIYFSICTLCITIYGLVNPNITFRHLVKCLFIFAIYSLFIFIIFKIFNVGSGDTEMFISLNPVICFITGYDISKIIGGLYLLLFISLTIAFIYQFIKKIINRLRNVKNTTKIAFAPYISISTLIIYGLFLFNFPY